MHVVSSQRYCGCWRQETHQEMR